MHATVPPRLPDAPPPATLTTGWPGHVTLLRRQARLLMDRGDHRAARPIWESLRRSLPRDTEARHCLAQIRSLLQREDQATRRSADVPPHELPWDAAPPTRMPMPAGSMPAGSMPSEPVRAAFTSAELVPARSATLHAPSARSSSAARSSSRDLTVAPAEVPQRLDDTLLDVHAAARAQDHSALLVALEAARATLPTEEARDLVALHGPPLLTWLGRLEHSDIAMREDLERRAAQLFARHDRLMLRLFRQIAEDGRVDAIITLLAELTSRPPPAPGDPATALRLVSLLLPGYAEEAQGAALAALLLGNGGRHREAVDWWRKALCREAGTANRRGLLAALRAAGDDHALAREIGSWLADDATPAARAGGERSAVIAGVRHLVQRAQQTGDASTLEAIELYLADQPPGPLASWIAASCALARNDGRAALSHLDAALRCSGGTACPPLDLHAERALVLMRDHLYGEALEAFALADPASNDGLYARRREHLQAIARFCKSAPHPLRYPECLVDVIMTEVAARPVRYRPRRGHVVMVAGSLGQGGGERQTQTMVRRLLGEPRIARLTLLVRSVHLKPGDDFFYDSVKALPVAHHVYGRDWAQPSTIATVLPELANRPHLARAIALMPHNMREEIIRLCRALWDHRPQAVHIWQDMHAAALACHIAGVPRFFIHRGSLSPDYWAQTGHQTATHFRPMRHCYRRLLERPDFVILNNSQAGCHTDQEWLGWPDASRFRVIYNAVDFAALGPEQGRNVALRETLGIADPAAPVIGGAFRLQPVKRPLWWAEAARLILQAAPDAHFLIIGDGDMTETVAAFATAHGFGHRLHLPGRVANVGDWYRAMDIKLLTSEREGIPNAIIEAQHFGVPVVATDVGGVAEAIAQGESGFAIKAQSPADYADAVIRILRDPAWQARARLQAPAHVHAMFSLDTVVDQLCGFYGLSRTCRSDADTGSRRDNA
ncbi:glycosyltransferase [Chelatococcus asaccharovorans]|uniref:Glycosyltransferase involved in cell wall biosynthesis n=1 Tax=Chelatococcus asaccharovorans TaxID=28210 RepID=A0A2V3TWZ6_9HYPH|nr:glycosyltransferase [Chelatococcus asaccharovorans]MBS7704243.1 glycosyltransferase [Chelatococcus asaccharovorans]PXW53129.1 glycosyltransferase involved in cell wall biosynthesis [Chelatococcus asaccharovorans]